MAKTRQSRKPPGHVATQGLSRNAGRRDREEDIDPQVLIDAKLHRVILEGVSHPIGFHSESNPLPDFDILHRMPIARDGQMNDLAIFCEQVIDGPAYVRVYDQDGLVMEKDREAVPVEVLLVSDDWANFPIFTVTKGQRLRFEIDNVRTFPENMSPADKLTNTGSDTLQVIGAWLTGMYFARGGNRGTGLQSTRPVPPRTP